MRHVVHRSGVLGGAGIEGFRFRSRYYHLPLRTISCILGTYREGTAPVNMGVGERLKDKMTWPVHEQTDSSKLTQEKEKPGYRSMKQFDLRQKL